MKQSEVFKMLQATGLPVTYSEWPQGYAPPLPYIVFLQDGTETFLADNKVYKHKDTYRIELYSENKDKLSENKIIEQLNIKPTVWEKEYEERTDEDLYQSVFLI